ncbi:hypothetical protein NADFUDRAFT_49746 [Nadsonia fulvescens var. elongata DSM 6958]|uniref:N-acetyltransferase domain-containing protein n=1 Tax=Nadsonia fulvescens var. elongata DSM 6958 TaxID=857566 RepID=A0A1E3PQW6_9ASCO|nr:hypothetical protein NADFUDRAFT_49746 [Nadsonia fulvescens var. elongata DSM 6958]
MCPSICNTNRHILKTPGFSIVRMDSSHLAQIAEFTNSHLKIQYPSKFFLQFVYGTNMFCYIVFDTRCGSTQIEGRKNDIVIGVISGKIEQKLQYNAQIGATEKYQQVHVYTLIVDPKYRRLGLGEDLLKYAIEQIRCTDTVMRDRHDNGKLSQIVVDVLLEYRSLYMKQNVPTSLPSTDCLAEDHENYELILRSNGIVKFYEKLGFTYERHKSTSPIKLGCSIEDVYDKVVIRKDEYMGFGDGLKMIMAL